MLFIFSVIALAAVRCVIAWGNVIIKNECGFPVYMWVVDANRNLPTTIQAKSDWSEAYHIPSTGGVSLKISTTDSDIMITQLEYTLNLTQSTIWYDGSNVNCAGAECPFYAYGLDLRTSDFSCPTRECPIDRDCTGFYIFDNDDVNSLSCDQNADITLTLCSIVQDAIGSSNISAPSVPILSSLTSTKLAVQTDSPITSTLLLASTINPAPTNSWLASTLTTAYAKHRTGQELYSIVPTTLSNIQPLRTN